MNKGICVVTFIIGVAVGSVTTWQLLKNEYEERVQEDVNSVKEMYCPKKDQPDNTKEEQEKPNLTEYNDKIADCGYTKYSTVENHGFDSYDKPVDDSSEKEMYTPEVISPGEFGEDEDYDKANLTYYADGVLADDNDEVVNDVDEVVGLESLDSFGIYEDDAVHVKNDKRKCYYEILRDERCYEDLMADKPHPADFDE